MCVCQSTRRFFKKSKFCPILYLGYLKERKKKEVFDIIYETHLCSRASERERKRERKKEREEEKERGRGQKRREDDEFGEGIAFPKEKAVFFKKETVRV